MLTRSMSLLALAAMLAAPWPALAQAADPEPGAEQRLQEASRRLEEAAREVARLSGEVYGPRIIEHIELGRPGPPRAMLGIMLGETGPSADGARVASVSPGGPAAEAGIRSGDLIVALDGKAIGSARELVRAMQDVKPGQKVEVTLRRDGQELKLGVEARDMDRRLLGGPMTGRMHPEWTEARPLELLDEHWLAGGWGDVELVTLTPALGRYFGADKGVLVVRAPEAISELEDGDVIQSIGGREPQNGPHAMRILRSYQPGEAVELRILRDRKARTVRLTVPEPAGPIMLRRRMVAPPAPPVPPAAPPPPSPADRERT